jgi:hypothetical protein
MKIFLCYLRKKEYTIYDQFFHVSGAIKSNQISGQLKLHNNVFHSQYSVTSDILQVFSSCIPCFVRQKWKEIYSSMICRFLPSIASGKCYTLLGSKTEGTTGSSFQY